VALVRGEDRLDGRVALVTGGSRGIGRATAVALAARGARVAVVAQTREAAQRTADEVQAIGVRGAAMGVINMASGAAVGVRSMAIGADVSDWPAVQRFVQQVVDELGPPDVLVNNAGVLGDLAPIAELSPESSQRTLNVNVLGPLHGMRAVLPLMLPRQGGVVVNLSSGAGQRPRPTRSMYGTSKIALDLLTTVAAAEVAGAGIRVYTVHPGLIDTDMNATDRARMPAEDRERALARIRAGDMQQAQEPAECIAWLATPSGAAWTDVVVPWREPQVRERIRQMPGFRVMQAVAQGN
jgi:NAD(P)-dependent dehydrogenase (short-subunit alcohol dehydrogenase family)